MPSAKNDAPTIPAGAWQHTCMRPGDEVTCPGCQALARFTAAVEAGQVSHRANPPEVGD